jgi:RNA polymerase II-associated factor 1
MSRRQDYIARIRYQNDLPPPPCPPKLLNIPVSMQRLVSSSFLSGLVQKQPMNMDVDIDLGMPLDMTEIQGIFDRGDESGVYPSQVDVLSAKDRALLRDPVGEVGTSKSQPGVSFLRRTEYISSETIKQKAGGLNKTQKKVYNEDPEARLKAVEATFDAGNSEATKLKHPKKRNITVAETFPVLPDSKMFDLMYLSVRMVGSASLNSQKKKLTDDELSTALFRRNVLGDDEWMSFYVTDAESSNKLKNKLDSPADTLILSEVDDDDNNVYRFNRVQDNDIDLVLHPTKLEEIAISFSEDHARYLPIIGRTNLKRRRVVKHRQEQVKEMNVASIDLSVREITANESVVRDNERSVYDPVTYPFTELEEEQEEVDVDGEENGQAGEEEIEGLADEENLG